ncbi:hypothetical protein H6F76_22580 [Leptolyngbya sp. FACHB-321]|uniref:hypothetical protein n=1 Tax=Leptolyngbya sp. FACHB-321 TaxID=2692807 RepID=UPI0016850857|nr:hypothetical protein [Leptolyngbya sp. FACHB-321]MBD2037744.1 hypothetical protein [Leptolyngbya sp. FACHB-321]
MELDYNDPHPLVATLARLFAAQGQAIEVAILANSTPVILQIDFDNWNGGTGIFNLILPVPHYLFAQIEITLQELQESIEKKAQLILSAYPQDSLRQVIITPQLASDEAWQEKAKTWLAGKGLTNQGRVRSDNVAPKTCDGLLFRSSQEINLYKAFKALGVSFAPLPVFIRGGKAYRRIEPDFVIIKDGLITIVEVDGDTVHHETPVEAYNRTTMLEEEGACLQRVNANDCDSPAAAAECAQEILRRIAQIKNART